MQPASPRPCGPIARQEFVPTSSRGYWGLAFNVCWTAGSILEAGVAWLVLPALGWRWLVALSSLPCALLVLLIWMMPESPRYLVSQGRLDEAQRVLDRIAKTNGQPLPRGCLGTASTRPASAGAAAAEAAAQSVPPQRAGLGDGEKPGRGKKNVGEEESMKGWEVVKVMLLPQVRISVGAERRLSAEE